MPKTPVQYITTDHGDAGIDQTVQAMIRLIRASLGNQAVRQQAEKIISNAAQNDMEDEAEQIYNYVRDYVRFTKDPQGLEYVQTPAHMIQVIEQEGKAYGDCDDKTVLGLALLKNTGHQVAIKTTSYNPNGKFSHVYGLVKLHGEWIPFDATRPDKWLGWEAGNIVRAEEYALDGSQDLGAINWERISEQAIGTIITLVAVMMLGLRR